MKESITEQIMARILSNPYQATNGLSVLTLLQEFRQSRNYYENCCDCKREFPFLSDEDLEPNNLNEILENLEKKIIEKINILVQEDGKNFYELTIFMIALNCIKGNIHECFNKIIKNDKVKLSYDFSNIMLSDIHMAKEQEFWLNEGLKMLRFN